MKISQLQASGFKGRSFTTNLKPITVIVGANFQGKSSRIEAMQLALAGFLPGIEKKPGAIFDRLSSHNPMSVRVQFEDGRYIERRYTKSPDGSVKREVTHRGLNPGFAVEPSIVDPLEFLGLSAKERVKFLFQRLRIEGEVPTPAALFDRLAKQQVEIPGPATDEFVADLRGEVEDDHENSIRAGIAPQAWLEALAATFANRKREADSRSRTASAAQQSRQDVSEPQKRLNAAEVESGLSKAKQALQDLRAAWSAKNSELALARQRLAASVEAGKRLDGLKALREQKMEVELKIDHDKAAAAKPMPEVTMPRQRVVAIQSEINAGRDELARARAELDAADVSLAEVEELTCCPFCDAKKPGWRAKVEQKRREAAEACAQKYARLQKQQEERNDRLKKANAELEIATLEFNAWETVRVRNEINLKRLNEINLKLAEVAALEAEAGAFRERENAVADAEAAASALNADLDAAEKVFNHANEQKQALAVQRSKDQERQATEAAQVKADVESSVLKAACAVAQKMLDDIVGGAMGPFCERLNWLCEGILPGAIAFRDNEFGMESTEAEKFVTWRSFSGTERALFTCGMAVALAADSEIKVAVLDEMGRLDGPRKLAVAERLDGLILEGKIEQAILVDVSPGMWEQYAKDNPDLMSVVNIG